MQPHALESAVKALRAVTDDLGPGAPVLLAWLEWLRGESLAGLSELSITPETGQAAVRMCPDGVIEQVWTFNLVRDVGFPRNNLCRANLYPELQHDFAGPRRPSSSAG